MTTKEKTVILFVDGMVITTSNSIATVEVRAKSFGPGFCNVDFTTDMGDSVSFNAPPLTWGPWMNLANHISEVRYTISHSVNCDTGIVGEVRYYKKE